jgi:hypothetical protein
MTLKQLEKKIAAVEKRLEKLEKKTRRGNTRRAKGARKTRTRKVTRSGTNGLSEQEKYKKAEELLRAKGMIAELTEREKQMAAEWRARPESERQRILSDFYNLKLDKPLSDIIAENRR